MSGIVNLTPPPKPADHKETLSSPRYSFHSADFKDPNFNYNSLAELIGREPGFAIFRRFATLNAKNLLYLQAELVRLERELAELENADRIADDEKRKDVQWVAGLLIGSDSEHWQKVLEIRSRLKEYNETLLQHGKLYSLKDPNKHDLDALRTWVTDLRYGKRFLELGDSSEYFWEPVTDKHGKETDGDLVALSERVQEGDRFSRWLTDSVVPFVHRNILHRTARVHDVPGMTYRYSDTKLNRAAQTLSITLASLMPTASIFALYYIDVSLWRLIFVLIFSAAFTILLAIFTGAKRIEIFAAAVAIASVQVVFIGSTLPASSTPSAS